MNSIKQYNKKDLSFISIKHNSYEVILCNLGASIYSIYLDKKPMTYQVDTIDEFKNINIHAGKTIGRVAGRIDSGLVVIDDKTSYKVSINEHNNTLHGGIDGLAHHLFKLKSIDNLPEYTRVIYSYLSPDSESGFRGNMLITITYEISHIQDSLKVYFNAFCDRICPINLTNHAYFNLGDKNLDNLSLQVKASKYVYPRDNDLLPLEIKDVNKALDFNTSKPIMQDINDPEINYGILRGYDHYLIFDKIDDNNPQIILQNNDYCLDVYTDYPGVQIFSDNYRKPVNHNGLTVETQFNPLDKHMINPHNPYNQFVKFVFSKKNI